MDKICHYCSVALATYVCFAWQRMLPVGQVSERELVVQPLPLTHTRTHKQKDTQTAAGSSAFSQLQWPSDGKRNGGKDVEKESGEEWKEVMCSTSFSVTRTLTCSAQVDVKPFLPLMIFITQQLKLSTSNPSFAKSTLFSIIYSQHLYKISIT